MTVPPARTPCSTAGCMRVRAAASQLPGSRHLRDVRADDCAQDECITRKKVFNMMEDMKGKIRVYARVRPMLGFEAERGQRVALNIPDELSLDHVWKDKKREYAFDAVFAPDASQDKACAPHALPTPFLIHLQTDMNALCMEVILPKVAANLLHAVSLDCLPGWLSTETQLQNVVLGLSLLLPPHHLLEQGGLCACATC